MCNSTIDSLPAYDQAVTKQRLFHQRASFHKEHALIDIGGLLEVRSIGKKQRLAKKSVSFNESVKVRRTIRRQDFTEDELCTTWFQPEEFHAIQNKVVLLVRKVQRDGAQLTKEKKFCTRGLESLMPASSQKKRQARTAIASAVFFEQDKQTLQQRIDVEAIASASRKISANSQALATAIALKDQKEALRYYSRILEE